MTEKLLDFDAADYLDSDEAIAEYLTAIMEADDAQLTIKALGDVAKAKGMAAIADAAGVGRASLYKSLRPGAQPKFDTIVKVLHAMGVRIGCVPLGDE